MSHDQLNDLLSLVRGGFIERATTMIEQALAKPEQEPVTWAETNDLVCALLRQAHDVLACASYPFKRPWVGLTDDDVDWILGLAYAHDTELVKTVEAKLKDKNG